MPKLKAGFAATLLRINACKALIIKDLRPLGSAVEHSLHTRGVSSSNLLAGTNSFSKLTGDPINVGVARFASHTFAHTLNSRSVIKSHKIDLFWPCLFRRSFQGDNAGGCERFLARRKYEVIIPFP